MCNTSSTISVYIGSRKTAEQKIKAIQDLIDAFEIRLIDVIAGEGSVTEEYRLDDGQMSVRTRYRSVKDLEAGISNLERMKQRYINRYNGRSVALRDVRGLH